MEHCHHHGADLPDPGLELTPLDRSKVQCLQILEWFQIHGNDPKLGLHPESTHLQRLLDWLKQFNPEKDLVDNPWLKRVTNTQDFRLFIRRIKKEPEYSEYFSSVISKRKDGYKSSSTLSEEDEDSSNSFKVKGDEIEVIADSLFLEDEDLAHRVLGIKSQFKCLTCQKTECDSMGGKIRWSSSPETLAKLYTLLLDGGMVGPDLNNVLVLGSGFGSVTFCTHLFVRDCKITSCEWDPKLSDLQERVVQKRAMTDRVTVLASFLPEDSGVVKCMDLVIGCERLLRVEIKQRVSILMNLKKCMKSGARLVLYRRLTDWLQEEDGQENAVKSIPEHFQDWLVLQHELCINDDEEAAYYHVYKVL